MPKSATKAAYQQPTLIDVGTSLGVNGRGVPLTKWLLGPPPLQFTVMAGLQHAWAGKQKVASLLCDNEIPLLAPLLACLLPCLLAHRPSRLRTSANPPRCTRCCCCCCCCGLVARRNMLVLVMVLFNAVVWKMLRATAPNSDIGNWHHGFCDTRSSINDLRDKSRSFIWVVGKRI
jgi:hypothetical protein